MNNRFETLKVFCSLAETLQFKETANRLAVSPPVVTRTIAELESYLGEALFQRNTRQVKLTEFGEQFLPQAQQLLADSERIFVPSKARMADEMAGVVRITVPELPNETAILQALAERLKSYPNLILDWRKDTARLNVVEHQIDIGVRVGMPADNRFIIKQLSTVREKIVASPKLLERLGTPQRWQELARYPLIACIDANTGRYEHWALHGDVQIPLTKPAAITNDFKQALPLTQAGIGVAFMLDWLCDPLLKTGELVELFPELERPSWQVYLYRPSRNVTPLRVKLVFDWLVEILEKNI